VLLRNNNAMEWKEDNYKEQSSSLKPPRNGFGFIKFYSRMNDIFLFTLIFCIIIGIFIPFTFQSESGCVSGCSIPFFRFLFFFLRWLECSNYNRTHSEPPGRKVYSHEYSMISTS